MRLSWVVAVRCALRSAMLCVVIVTEVGAQRVDGGRAGVVRSGRADSSVAFAAVAGASPDSLFVLPLAPRLREYAPLISAVIPGGGQLALGNGRFVAYVVVEAISWWNYQKNRNELNQETEAFKQLANGVARAAYSSKPADREWAYYEQMRDYKESGAYSKTDAGPLVPETDTATFNEYKWQLALRNHGTLAEALADYQQVAIKPGFQWSWKNHTLEYDIFKRTTALRNDANQRASNYLLAIGANHILSMIDAFATIRLQVQAGANGGGSIGASIGW